MDWKALTKNKWLLFLAAMGVVMLLVSSYLPGQSTRSATATVGQLSGDISQPAASGHSVTDSSSGLNGTSTSDSASTIEANYDASLEHVLGEIQGIHAVTVMVTVDSSSILHVAKNNTSSQTVSGSGQQQSTTKSGTAQIYSGSSGANPGPYVISSQQPKVQGVLVTVNADDFATAKLEIIESITNVLDVPAYKISVEPQKEH